MCPCTDLWEPWAGHRPGPPGHRPVSPRKSALRKRPRPVRCRAKAGENRGKHGKSDENTRFFGDLEASSDIIRTADYTDSFESRRKQIRDHLRYPR